MDLSYFDTPITPAPADILFDMRPSLGTETTGRRSKTLRRWASMEFNCGPMCSRIWQPHGTAGLARKAPTEDGCGLQRGVRIDLHSKPMEIAKHTANAKFVHDVGGLYLKLPTNA